MKLSIIIVSWNVQRLLERCLLSIHKYAHGVDYTVAVVDNASRDDSVAMLKKLQRQCLAGKLVICTNTINVGFSRACIQGIKALDLKRKRRKEAIDPDDWILLLNPDTELLTPIFHRLNAYAERHPEAGVIGPTLFSESGAIQKTIRRFPGVMSQTLILLKLHRLLPALPSLQRYWATDLDYRSAQLVEQVQGAFFLIRRSCWDALGGMDPNFFLWFEEVDFCKRAWSAGWQVHYVPTTGLVHHSAQSFGQLTPLQRAHYFHKSVLWYMAKHKGFWGWFILWCLRPISSFFSIIATLFEQWNSSYTISRR